MATQTIGAQTVELVEAGRGVRERAGEFFNTMGKIAWRVSVEVQPLLAGFVPPYTMECLTSEHLSPQEKARIRVELNICC